MATPGAGVFPSSGIWPGIETSTSVFLFSPPGIKRAPSGSDRFWSRFHSDRSLSVLKNGAAYIEVDTPDAEDVEAADAVYLGGHTYTVSAEEADALTTAGFGTGISSP